MPSNNNNKLTDNNNHPNEVDIFDEIWTSVLNTATDLTRSLVGLPMFYRHGPHDSLRYLTDKDGILVFAEPYILSPRCISFDLDRDIGGIIGPFRIETRPVRVFDLFWQPLRGAEKREQGMIFWFRSPFENTRRLESTSFSHPGE